MSKIVIEKKKDKITITNRLSYPETVNERVYNAIAAGMIEGLLPVSMKQKKKETQLDCVVQGLSSFYQYFNGYVTKQVFLDFVCQIVQIIRNCERNMVNANNLDLDNDKVFIDRTNKVHCIFWPIVNNQLGRPPHLYFQQLPFALRFNPNEDPGYLEEYKAFFSDTNPFSINGFEQMIFKLQGRPITGRITPSGALSGKAQSGGEKQSEAPKAAVEYDPFAVEPEPQPAEHTDYAEVSSGNIGTPINEEYAPVLFCTNCGAKLKPQARFCIACGTPVEEDSVPPQPPEVQTPKPQPPKPQPAKPKVNIAYAPNKTTDIGTAAGTVVLGDDSGGTTVLGFDTPEEKAPVFPKLRREKTGEIFEINKPTYRIGAEPQMNDCIISDNTYVSRRHADIITKGERYYIIDRKSLNRSFLDGRVILPEQEVEIFSGTSIRLADEDFVFIIES